MLVKHKLFISALALLGTILSGSVLAGGLTVKRFPVVEYRDWFNTGAADQLDYEDEMGDGFDELIAANPAKTPYHKCLDAAKKAFNQCRKTYANNPQIRPNCAAEYKEERDYCKERYK